MGLTQSHPTAQAHVQGVMLRPSLQCAGLIAKACSKYGEAVPSLQQRVTQQLSGALASDTRPLTSQYGVLGSLSPCMLP